MLFGNYVANGKVNLLQSVKQIGLDDIEPLLPVEESATLQDLLMSRSGIYFEVDRNAPRISTPPEPPSKSSPGKTSTTLSIPTSPEYAMNLSTRDMARLGLLMLREGNWDGKQLLPKNWTRYLTTLNTQADQLWPPGMRPSGPSRGGYGALWWVWDAPIGHSSALWSEFTATYTAMGTDGQFITVLPLPQKLSHRSDPRTRRIVVGISDDTANVSYLAILVRCVAHAPTRAAFTPR
jgi:CubicO group peptidase (beta-lactamase class C family)